MPEHATVCTENLPLNRLIHTSGTTQRLKCLSAGDSEIAKTAARAGSLMAQALKNDLQFHFMKAPSTRTYINRPTYDVLASSATLNYPRQQGAIFAASMYIRHGGSSTLNSALPYLKCFDCSKVRKSWLQSLETTHILSRLQWDPSSC